MGSYVSKLVDTDWVVQDRPLLTLPDEFIVRYLAYLPSSDRKNLRLTCKKLAHDIRHFVGASDICHIKKDTSLTAMEFYGESAFRTIVLSRNCRYWRFNELFHRPRFLKEFRFLEDGKMSPHVAVQLIYRCQNLRTLVWEGYIDSLELLVYGAELTNSNLLMTILQKLKTLKLRSCKPPRYDRIASREWYQLRDCSFLVKKLLLPKLDDLTLDFSTIVNGNASEQNESQLDLVYDVYDFLSRNFLDVAGYGISRPLTSIAIYNTATVLSAGDDVVFDVCGSVDYWDLDDLEEEIEKQEAEAGEAAKPRVVVPLPAGDLVIRDFTFVSELQNHRFLNGIDKDYFETHMLKLLMKVKGLENLKLKTRSRRPIKWSLLGVLGHVVSQNAAHLVHLELTSFVVGSFNFDIFSQCLSLKFIRIDRKDWDGQTIYGPVELSPLISNFGQVGPKLTKLETLILSNLGIRQHELYRLGQFKSLKHLVIDYWENESPLEGVNYDIIKIMIHLRSLDTLHLLQKNFLHATPWEMMSLEYGMKQLGFNYSHKFDQANQRSGFALSTNFGSFWTDPFSIPKF